MKQEQVQEEKEKEDEKEKQSPVSLQKIKAELYIYMLKKILCFKFGRDKFLKNFEKKLYTQLVENATDRPKQVMLRKYDFLTGMVRCAKRNIDKGYLKNEIVEKIIDNFARNSFIENYMKTYRKKDIQERFEQKYGTKPASFMLISPTQKCNLKCEGCYASSRVNCPSLPFDVVDKIVDEASNNFGNNFMTISGGEPFMYNDNGKTLFDIWEKHKDMFFLVYTNGTQITPEVAERLGECANVTPAISIEGWEKETDERRGKGVFNKIKEATKNLQKAGIPYGASITVTKKNVDILLDEKYYDYLFHELGMTYVWMFQLMPIGQASDIGELMITPEQRLKLLRVWEKVSHEKKYCIADFWNSGVLSDGCIAYGRQAGYFYIDWNGNIMPCVFTPYYEDNILDLYKEGKTLGDALNSNLFKRGRKWQNDYGLSCGKTPGNWLMPCSFRDHWKNFKENILTPESKPEDIHAEKTITSKEYDKQMEKFDEELEKLSNPIWENEYLDKEEDGVVVEK